MPACTVPRSLEITAWWAAKVPEATIELLQVDSIVLVYIFLLNPIFQIQKYSKTKHFTRKQLDVKGNSYH
jgi:hypothetical protein